ncbi:MAG: BlaI/MecI/CopY family transcriptional regulator [Bacteroidales bacterium]|nr:BlaI/MecI/CopY family transcriptional regulator [Bacteroidales bacterium]MCB9013822.1 BlaI/MecI/CopY family transcriptional regulator [Bacteroidales bacterium]
MKELTRAEEQVMQILWDIQNGFVKDIIERIESPKPAYNTISTIVRILESKGFVGHEEFGKSHRYFPLIQKKDYSKVRMNEMVMNYFENSASQVVSFFARNRKMDVKEVDEIIKQLQELKDNNHE